MPLIDKNVFRSDRECITYSCHSAARRAQFSISDGGTREVEGSEANKKIMHNASSMSRTASMKVGYLAVYFKHIQDSLIVFFTHLSLIMWSRRYTGLLSSRCFAVLHSPLPKARDSFLANALCSRSFFSTGS